MKLLLTFSLLLLLNGCASKKEIIVKTKYIHTKCPKLDYEISASNPLSFTIKQKNGKIVISKQEFKNIVSSYIKMKKELNQTNKIIKKYNKMVERINNEKH